MDRFILRSLERLEKYNGKLEQAFDIPTIKDLGSTRKELHVSFEHVGYDTLKISIDYSHILVVDSKDWMPPTLPEDLEKQIYDFLKPSDGLKLRLHMKLRDIPLRAPRINVTYCSNPLLDIYTVIEIFNCQIRECWSPAFGIQTTIHMLLCRILEEIKYV